MTDKLRHKLPHREKRKMRMANFCAHRGRGVLWRRTHAAQFDFRAENNAQRDDSRTLGGVPLHSGGARPRQPGLRNSLKAATRRAPNPAQCMPQKMPPHQLRQLTRNSCCGLHQTAAYAAMLAGLLSVKRFRYDFRGALRASMRSKREARVRKAARFSRRYSYWS